MPTFVLKKYNPVQKPAEGEQAAQPVAGEQKEEVPEMTMKIRASATVSEIVALALYRSLPNNVKVEEIEDSKVEPGQDTETNVITTEDINLDPIKTFQSVVGKSKIAIIGHGFSTEKDDWFLINVQSQGVKPMYTMAGLISHVKATLGV